MEKKKRKKRHIKKKTERRLEGRNKNGGKKRKMPFTINVAADLYGKKYNSKMSFPLCPEMVELLNAVESCFDVKARANRPPGYADVPFKAQALQLHDTGMKKWVDVSSTTQLVDGCQVFCFQPDSIWHTDAKGVIPQAAECLTWVSTELRRKSREAGDSGPPPSLTEKLRSVFYAMDTKGKGCVQYSDLRSLVAASEIDFTITSTSEVFTSADANNDGMITYDEWVQFSLTNTNVVDAIFFKQKDRSRVTKPNPDSNSWLASVPAVQQEELNSVHTAAAWARERVQTLREYESSRREATMARLTHTNAEGKRNKMYSEYLSLLGPDGTTRV
eukprot:TRINITY_DN13196_c0_g1_i1.p1 TRINITY_DN13196_c0_g1~~TRINITY_DN13196_c0_g1_i1.p1  ORF type:complete len:331 (+),score=82.00 TRINITY_DN13196_c0_g1_i1:239-1231(+)